MATVKEYEECFKPNAVPSALVKLIEFANAQNGWFSDGFELQCDSERVMFATYSQKPEFLDCLFPFAQADSTGSTYAIWRQSGDLNDAPVVAFGSEGGAHVVGSNLAQLLRILTFDAEPMISWDEVIFYKSADAEPSQGAVDYAGWLTKNFTAKPVRDATEVEQIVKEAQTLHEERFQQWLKRFFE